ncbi:MAG: hypothetical protein ACYS26_02775 [Planctomycetota bacterium]|jgi:hypothetical protein
MATTIFDLDSYTVLANPTGVLNLPSVGSENPALRHVGGFVVFGPDGSPVAYRDDSAPRLRADFEIWSDDLKQERLLHVQPREQDGRTGYVVQAGEESIGELWPPRSRGLLAKPWSIHGADGKALGTLGDTNWKHRLKRGLGRAEAESLQLVGAADPRPAFFLRQADPLRYMLRVMIPEGSAWDRRLVLAAALVMPAVEGFTAFLADDRRR